MACALFLYPTAVKKNNKDTQKELRQCYKRWNDVTPAQLSPWACSSYVLYITCAARHVMCQSRWQVRGGDVGCGYGSHLSTGCNSFVQIARFAMAMSLALLLHMEFFERCNVEQWLLQHVAKRKNIERPFGLFSYTQANKSVQKAAHNIRPYTHAPTHN